MEGLRILITNNTLEERAGTELYVRDVALALIERGHTPIAYSTRLGTVARELRKATVPVIDDLDLLTTPPDIIHGHHHLDTMTALLRFPSVPAIYLCHGWLPWEESPPRFPRILRYVAVDHLCRERLIYENGIPEERVQVLLNFVDLNRFKPRGPLPPRPHRALIFSNGARNDNYVMAVREACADAGIELDVIGLNSGNICPCPEEVLVRYDLVFAKARAAIEALAVGTAVVLCDVAGLGQMVTTADLNRLRLLNFGVRTLRHPITHEAVAREIARYNPADAAAVSAHIRAEAGRDRVVDQLIELYRTVIAEHANVGGDTEAELRAASRYIRWLSPKLKGEEVLQFQSAILHGRWGAILSLLLVRLRNRLLRFSLFAKLYGSVKKG